MPKDESLTQICAEEALTQAHAEEALAQARAEALIQDFEQYLEAEGYQEQVAELKSQTCWGMIGTTALVLLCVVPLMMSRASHRGYGDWGEMLAGLGCFLLFMVPILAVYFANGYYRDKEKLLRQLMSRYCSRRMLGGDDQQTLRQHFAAGMP